MAIEIYRFRANGPSIQDIEKEVPGTPTLSASSTNFVDISVDSANLADLQDSMKSRGYTLDSTNPTLPPDSQGGQALDVKSFGAVGDGVADDSSAIQAAIEALTNQVWPNAVGGRVYLPAGTYRCAKSIRLTRGVVLEGASGAGWYAGSILKFDAGVDGVVVDRYNTSFDSGAGDWSVIQNLWVKAAGQTTTAHGILLWARAKIENCLISSFAGNGINITCDSGAPSNNPQAWVTGTTYKIGDNVLHDTGKWYFALTNGVSGATGPTGTGAGIVDGGVTWNYVAGTNANNWCIQYCRSESNGGHGLFVADSDANAGVCTGLDCSGNTGWGIWDQSFLGNTYVGCHTASNIAGPYRSLGVNARNLFSGCYSESDQTGSEIIAPAMVIGGLHAAGFTSNSTFSGLNDGVLSGVSWQNPRVPGVGVPSVFVEAAGSSQSDVFVVEPRLNGVKTGSLSSFHFKYGGVGSFAPGFYRWDLENSDSNMAMLIGTDNQGFRPAGTVIFPSGLAVGNYTSSVLITRALDTPVTEFPTTAFNAGDFCYKIPWPPGSGVYSDDVIGWRCTNAGTPGTWRPVYDVNRSIVNKTVAYTLTTHDYIVTGDTTAAAFALTLPTAVGFDGKQYVVKRINSGANVLTVNTTSSQTIDGNLSVVVGYLSALTFVSDGSNWILI